MGLFPTDASNGDEVTNTNGTVYKYNAAEDRWYIIGNVAAIEDIVDDTTPQLGGDLDLNGFKLDFPTTPNIDDVIDDDTFATADAFNLATAESIKAYVDGLASVYGYDTVPIFVHSADYISRAARMNAVSEQVGSYFYIGNHVDPTADIVFTFFHNCTSADATVAHVKYADAVAVGSEAITWRIWNNVAINIDSTVANRVYSTTLTIPNASISAGDLIIVLLSLQEAARTLYFLNCEVRYTKA